MGTHMWVVIELLNVFALLGRTLSESMQFSSVPRIIPQRRILLLRSFNMSASFHLSLDVLDVGPLQLNIFLLLPSCKMIQV